MRSLAAFMLQRPASAWADSTISRQASTQASGTVEAVRAADPQGRVAQRLLGLRIRGRRRAAREVGIRGGSRRRRVRSRRSARVATGRACRGVRRRMVGVLRAALTDSDATIATRPAARDAATAEALPPPGTGSDEASASTKPPTVRSARARRLARIWSRWAWPNCRRRHVAVANERGCLAGQARYRRAALRDEGARQRPREGSADGLRSWRDQAPQAARRDSANPRGSTWSAASTTHRRAPMLVGHLEARAGRLDLEERARPGLDRIGRLAPRGRGCAT